MKKWQKKEKKDAKDFGGDVTARSGGFWAFAGDVKSDTYLIDSKYTEKDGYRITKKIWDKIHTEAIKARKTPILSLDINGMELVVMDKDDYLALFIDK